MLPDTPKQKIIFFGTPEIAANTLRTLYSIGFNIIGTVTQPDKPTGRQGTMTPPPVKVVAQELNIPVFQPATIRDGQFLTQLQELKPDLCIVISYGKIFPPEFFSISPLGFVNVHYSLLPKYRGASPVQSAILNGDSKTGCSIIKMDAKIDHGPIVYQFEEEIKPDDTSLDLYNRIFTKTAEVLKVGKEKDNFIIITTEEDKFLGRSVIIATGADPRPLEAKGEKEFIGKGVSYCVTCDGPVFSNKTVAIIGGGDAGFEAALFMTNYANKVYILESGLKVKANKINQNEVKKSKKIEIITSAFAKEIKGDKLVSSLIYEDSVSKKNKILQVEGIFIEIGTQPATSLAKGLVDFNKRDEIIVEFETLQTKVPGLFAAGDANAGPYKQIVTAAGEGCKAALAAYEYIQKIK